MKRVKKTIFIIAVLTVTLMLGIIFSNKITISQYEVLVESLEHNTRIVMFSDLHSREFGEGNVDLIELIAEQEPDAILAVGDIMTRKADEKDIQQMLELFVKLEEIAPMFFSPGNHEMDYMLEREGGSDLMDRIRSVGVTALCDEYVETEIGGNTIRIGGTLGHYYGYNWTEEQWASAVDYAMQKEIGSTDVPAIVMMHMPETMIGDSDSVTDTWQADLFLSGHTHGGLIRLPGIGGLVAPTQGLFPTYDKGEFLYNGKLELIISGGLAGYGIIPRIFNPPEILVIDLVSK